MVQIVLFLLLLNTSPCWGFGFRSCSQNYPTTNIMWCYNKDIVNLSEVISMIPVNATDINMSKNKISVIPPGSFSQLLGLKTLNLSQNQLVSLKGGEFSGLGILDLLNLTSNNISSIHSDAFVGLTRLQTLLLPYNMLATISPGVFHSLPAIQLLDLSQNMLTSFSCTDTGGSTTLKQLHLFANNIQRVNVSCFPALEYIRLSNNSKLELQADVFASNPRLKDLLLQSVKVEALVGLSLKTKRNLFRVAFSLFLDKSPLTICDVLKGMDQLRKVEIDLKGSRLPQRNYTLQDCALPAVVIIMDANFGNVANLSLGYGNTSYLYFINCGLKQISKSTFEGFPRLKTLQLNQNKVIIEQDAFKGLSHLTFLSVDRGNLRDIDPHWFVPLKKLTRLSLMKNQVLELEPMAFSSLSKLEQLYFQFNLLKYITRKPFSKLRRLTKLNLSLNIIDFIEQGSFEDLISLRYLDLSGNRIKRVTQSILSGLVNLKHLVLYNNRLHFRSNEVPFAKLTSLQYLEMNYQGPGGDGIGEIGPHFFQGQHQLIGLAMGHSIKLNIHPDALGPLVNLKELYIAGVIMKMTNLSAVLSPLKRMRKLTLFRVDLEVLPAPLLPPDNALETLKVQSNHLHTVDKMMLDSLPRLLNLEITDNPLTCTCDNAWFKNWAIHSTQTQVEYLYNIQCDNNQRSPYLWQFDDKACSYDEVSLTLFVTCSVLDVVFVCLCLAWHTQGPAIRYLLLVLKTKLHGRRGAAGPKYQYDAFISYSSEDEAWVMGQLVPNLERPAVGAPRLKLCLHHRNFRPGTAVLENIEAAIYSSRHTICVVTRHFLRSEWCSVEFQLASLRLLCDGRDVLLLVFLEEIPQHCLSPYTRLRKIVRKKTYLQWPEKPEERNAFWVRLRDALKNNEEEEEEEGGGREDELARLIG